MTGARYYDERVCNLYVCSFVSLFARVSQKPRVQTSQHYLYMLLVAVALCSSDENAISYALLLLWIMSCFHIMWRAVLFCSVP